MKRRRLRKLIISALIGSIGIGVALHYYQNLTREPTICEVSEPQSGEATALLYDIQLGAFSEEGKAVEVKNSLESRLREEHEAVSKKLKIVSGDNLYRIVLDLNIPEDHAQQIKKVLQDAGVDDAIAYRCPTPFNLERTRGKFAYLIVDNSLEDTVKRYTRAYSGEIPITATSLIGYYRQEGLFKDTKNNPQRGDIAPIPIRFLKMPYQLGMKEGEDYYAVELESGQTIWNVASQFTQGSINNNVAALLRFNAMREEQVTDLAQGTPILIPRGLYHDPEKPTVITQIGSNMMIIPERVDPEIERPLLSRIPELPTSAYQPREMDYAVLRDTNMPAVLIESFNIQNDRQLSFYSNDKNLIALAETYGRGIINYKRSHNRSLTTVIIDDGHGKIDPGAIHVSSGKAESEFTAKIQRYLAEYLREHGLTVHEISYGGVGQNNRLRHYAMEANRLGNPKDSIYVSVHVDSLNKKASPPPRLFVYDGKGKEKRFLLANEMLLPAIDFYKKNSI